MTNITRLEATSKSSAFAGQTICANLYATSSQKLGGLPVYIITDFCLHGEQYGWQIFKNREWKTRAGALRAAARFGAFPKQ